MKLSNNFELEEFLHSDTAIRLGVDMTPSEAVIDNLVRLCTFVLEPLRLAVGKPIHISSGYRPPELNKIIGGASNSAHMFGCAADCTIEGMTSRDIVKLVKMSAFGRLNVDQAIDEFSSWAHLAVAKAPGMQPRNDWLAAVRGPHGTEYSAFS